MGNKVLAFLVALCVALVWHLAGFFVVALIFKGLMMLCAVAGIILPFEWSWALALLVYIVLAILKALFAKK